MVKGFIFDFDGTIAKDSAGKIVQFIYEFINKNVKNQKVSFEYIKNYYKTSVSFNPQDSIALLFEGLGISDKTVEFKKQHDTIDSDSNFSKLESSFSYFLEILKKKEVEYFVLSLASQKKLKNTNLELADFGSALQSKSNPAVFESIIKKKKIENPSEWIYVDDSPLALSAAKSCGFTTVMMINDVFTEVDYRNSIDFIDYKIDKFFDLIEFFFPEEKSDPVRFQDKIVLVTGGSSGMGRDIAYSFYKEGAILHICGTNIDKGLGVIAEFKKKKRGEVFFHSCDVSDASQVEALIKAVIKLSGKLDIAVNNAGVSCDKTKLSEITVDEWKETININLSGLFYCMKYQLKEMVNQGYGKIINNASTVGLMPVPNKSAYIASKAGVIALTKSAALEYGSSNIQINSIAPGIINDTGMNPNGATDLNDPRVKKKLSYTPVNRFGELSEVSSTVLWLCLEESSFINGTVIPIDGGFQAGKI